MPIELQWSEIAIRLLCALVAGAAIGLNRGEHGHAAGLRTSILVCAAACIAMIQVNLLLPLAGRLPNSFVMNDLMRLPLGILSGMGFIGAGAIVRRENLVVGVTTAASLWFLTVLGLCFGGGQVALGLVGVLMSILVLSGLKLVEERMKQDCQGKLLIVMSEARPSEDEIRSILQNDGFQIMSCAFASQAETQNQELSCQLRWRAKIEDTKVPAFVHRLTTRDGVVRVTWSPQANG